MLDVQATLDSLGQLLAVVRQHLPPLGDRWADARLWAVAAVFLGGVFSLWGARLLRTGYILIFMVMGGAIGVRVAGASQIDVLIGLVVGAGVSGLIGYLLFRWWIGMTAGLVAVLMLATLSAPRVLAEVQAFNDAHQGVGTADYRLPSPTLTSAPPAEQAEKYLTELKDYLLKDKAALVYRSGFALAVVWLFGTAVGLLFPRFATIVGTAVVGVSLLAYGGGVMLSTYAPSLWATLQANTRWTWLGLAVLALASISYQGWRPVRRPVEAPAAQQPVAKAA
jgi:hypothetical protein